MSATKRGNKLRRSSILLASLGVAFLSGCGQEPVEMTAVRAASGRAASAETSEEAPKEPRVSVFEVTRDSIDPFFPTARKVVTPALATPGNTLPSDPRALLTAGFQGIMGTPDRRMAIIHNTVLEPRRSAVIVARSGGREYKLPVRCLDVTVDSVTIQLDGQTLPITITRPGGLTF